MTSSTYHLIYQSVAHETLAAEDIFAIIRRSQEWNGSADLTGILLFRNRCFLQVLEGQEALVEELFRKISKDTRHHSVERLHDGPMVQRTFPRWRMKRFAPSQTPARLTELAPEFGHAPDHIKTFVTRFLTSQSSSINA